MAEILLRKTTRKQVAQVLGRFLEAYPTLATLAKSSARDISLLIRPLGMEHMRARLLRTLAMKIITQHRGTIPSSREALLDLPGIGPYTANAVLCLTANQNLPLVDTNAIRVVSRVFSYKSSMSRLHTDRTLWEFVGSIVPNGKGRDFGLGLLDFAANICTPRPKCSECPMTPLCDYYQTVKDQNKDLQKHSIKYLIQERS